MLHETIRNNDSYCNTALQYKWNNLYGGRKHQFPANWKKREFTLKVAAVAVRDLTKLRRRRQAGRQKGNRFNEQNHNSACASRFFVHFFAVPAQLRREMTKFSVCLRTRTARR